MELSQKNSRRRACPYIPMSKVRGFTVIFGKTDINPGKLLIIPSVILGITLLSLGIWWLYLISEGIPDGLDTYALIKWEGPTFIIVLFLLLLSMFYLYWLDQKKTRSLRDFFASMTHELKTPLAGIRLQAEVMAENVEEEKYEKLPLLSKRLTEQIFRLETQMDKILQLSRLESGGNLNLTQIFLKDFFNEKIQVWKDKISVEIKGDNEKVMADEFALDLIFRNLFENTFIHSSSQKAVISIKKSKKNQIELIYEDTGGPFKGDSHKIGDLFYKFNSPKGSGIGVYLIKQLLGQMGGKLEISSAPYLTFTLFFKGPSV